MSEIKFKSGTQLPADTSKINESDIVMINNNMNGTNESESGFGSVYKGTKIVGTTKADELLLTEPITVIGTNVGNISNNDTLAKGTSIEEILKMMLQKEVGINTIKPTVSGFSVTPADAVEVGTNVTATLSVTYVDGKYDSADNNLWNPNNLPTNAGCTAGTIKWTYNGEDVTSPHTFTAVLGDNKFTYTIPYSASTVTSVKNNLGNDVDVNIEAGNLTNSKTIKGYYRWNAFSSSSNNITKTETSWPFTTTTTGVITVADGDYAIVAVPSGYTLKTAEQMTQDFIPSFTTSDVTLTIGGTSTHTYKIYYWKNISGSTATINNIKIG